MKKLVKVLVQGIVIAVSYLLANRFFMLRFETEELSKVLLFGVLGLACLAPYYIVLFRIVGIIKTHKVYKEEIKQLKDKVFNNTFEYNNELRKASETEHHLQERVAESQRELQQAYETQYILSENVEIAEEETVEAKAKYVELVNNSYRGEK